MLIIKENEVKGRGNLYILFTSVPDLVVMGRSAVNIGFLARPGTRP